ncbi:MAG: UvrD-helicase domain-containing protein [Ignavibacteria bacterium]|jgi:ATP-dependent helicase/nuclease subunit A|nr:UvrD-helicase domain-containing protein [Ignavibacteria bacterium]
MAGITPHQQAALNYKEHISLTANAGSGKTFVLSRRYVEIALKENVSLRNIVAITFTDKAAGELYKKISEEVQRRYLESTDYQEKKIIERIRRQLVSANISTIHSFCIDILREFPLEAELDANFTPIDQNLSDELLDLSVEETIKHYISDEENSGKLKYLIRIFASKNVLKSVVASLIQKRKNILKLASDVYTKDEKEISTFFYTNFEKYVSQIVEANREKVIISIKRINSTVLSHKPDNPLALEVNSLLCRLQEADSFSRMLAILKELKGRLITSSTSSLKKVGYLNKEREVLSAEIRSVEEYFSEIAGFDLPGDHEEVEVELARFGKNLIEVFDSALNAYGEKKRQMGYLDFEDILILTQNILVKEDVCRALREKLQYVMIDEYQDTNEVQYEIFMPILDYLRQGNLFIVGDEKQSIYMFRDAELKVFNRTKSDIMMASGEKNLLNLPDSFRMAPAICLFTNYIFRSLFSNPNPVYNEVNYCDLVCAKDETTPGGVEIILADKTDETNTEAELIARKIVCLTGSDGTQDIRFDDIAILCRKRKSFEELERAFNRYHIPFTIVGGTGFYQKQLVSDIYNYLSFLLNRENDAALVSILRSPFFSLSDVEIYEISLREKYCFWESLKAYAPESPKIQEVASILENNLVLVHQYDLTSLLRRIIRESSYLTVLSSKPNGLQEIANLEKLIAISHNFSISGYKTLYDFINYLSDAIINIDDEGQASVALESACVKIMTLHQAKGLEYKAVFLYACHEYTQQDTVRAKSVVINKDFGLLTSVPVNNNYFEDYRQAPIVSLHNFMARKKNLAEIKRLLYVGVTRAKNYLYISATHKDYKFNPESFMSLILTGLKIKLPVEAIEINFEQSFLKSLEDGFTNETKTLSLNIPVVNQTGAASPIEISDSSGSLVEKILKIDPVPDMQEDETISATKIAVYTQCPMKYYLTYELGYSKLLKTFQRDFTHFDFKQEDEEPSKPSFADVKGKLLHFLLEHEAVPGSYEDRLEELIKSELHFVDATAENLKSIKDSVIEDLNSYLSSRTCREIRSFRNFKNEFELLVREKDFYLYGIVDKLVLEDKRVIVIDFKSDGIAEKEIHSRKEHYLPQLKFYAYLISKLYTEVEEVEIRLVFLKHPEVEVKSVLKKTEIEAIGFELYGVVDKIRRMEFNKNLNHCYYCHYSMDKRCIMQ